MLDKIYNKDGKITATVSEKAGEELASYKLKNVLRHLNMSTFDYDIQKDTVYVRKGALLLPDFTGHWFTDAGEYYYLENLTERLSDIVRESFVTVARQEMEKVKHNTSGEMISFDAPIVYSGGNTRWTNFVFDTVLDEEGRIDYAVGYCKDISEQKKELYRLRNVAQTDYLTGFRNRASGMAKIEIRLKEEKDASFFIAVVDLNKFKQANDLFGHSFGDMILKDASSRMREACDSETLCCRTGGDEFMFFRKCDSVELAMEMLSKMKEQVKHSVSYQGYDFQVDASFGFAMSPLHGVDFDELYNKADAAMYYAKQNNADAPVLYEETMDGVRKK